MKTWPSSLLLAVLPLLLAGCASTQETARADAPAQSPRTIVEDDRYVAYVEKIARERGTRVVWVNRPQKRVSNRVDSNP